MLLAGARVSAVNSTHLGQLGIEISKRSLEHLPPPGHSGLLDLMKNPPPREEQPLSLPLTFDLLDAELSLGCGTPFGFECFPLVFNGLAVPSSRHHLIVTKAR